MAMQGQLWLAVAKLSGNMFLKTSPKRIFQNLVSCFKEICFQMQVQRNKNNPIKKDFTRLLGTYEQTLRFLRCHFGSRIQCGTSAETLRDGKTIIFCSKFTREKLIEIIIVCYTKTKNS